MNEIEANIRITTQEGKRFISVFMPVWHKQSDQGNLVVSLPLLGIETIAKDEKDSEKAIEEAITSFCIVADKFGQGIEKELFSLGWTLVDDITGTPVLGYTISDSTDTDRVVERLMQTGDQYVNSHLEIA